MSLNALKSSCVAVVLCLLQMACSESNPAPPGVPETVIRSNTLGTAYLGQQEWAKAADSFNSALSLRPEDPLLLTNLAIALSQDGQPEAAEAQLRLALAADPSYPYAHYNLGLIESNRGNFEAAAVHFEAVAAFDPDDVLVQYNLGTTYSSLERTEEAVTRLRQALQIDPEHVSSLYALGRALVTTGARDEGRELIGLSQTIRARSGLDTAVGSQYGEQGWYAMGIDYPGDVLLAPAPNSLEFVADGVLAQDGEGNTWTAVRVAPDQQPVFVGSDGSVVGMLGSEVKPEILPHHPLGNVLALTAGDGNNDGVVELYALIHGTTGSSLAAASQSESGDFSWTELSLTSDLADIAEGISAGSLLMVDREHDGDLDLLICWTPDAESACAVATNDGEGRFTLARSGEHGFAVTTAGSAAPRLSLSDFDNDRDIDLLVFTDEALSVLSNQRDGTFRSVGDAVGLGGAAGSSGSVAVDLNKDSWMDVITVDGSGMWLWTNDRGKYRDRVQLADHSQPADTVTVLDADNDGFLDLFVSATGVQTVAYRNLGGGQFEESPGWLQAQAASVVGGFDADLDGDLDLVAVGDEGLTLLRNDGGNANQWISVNSRGVGDNSFGIGAKVEVLAGGLRQKFEITDVLPVHAGLGSREQVDSVRHLWPSGVLQDEIEQLAGSQTLITQLDRKGTSCPILYVWRDGQWEFVTDFLGGSAVGYQLSEGVFNTPDTDEYIKIPHAPSVGEDGTIRLRVNNQLQEIIWFDQLELVAVDHPQGTQLYPNERLMPEAPWPHHELFISNDIRPIKSAVDVDDGRDWSAELMEAEGDYVTNFKNLRFKGYADMHVLELDLGSLPPDQRIVLLLDGWIDYADSTANVAASQAGVKLVPPVLTLADGKNGWRETGHLMGFPAGLPKTMAVELTDLLHPHDRRVRISTNMRIYWDRARVLVGGSESQFTTHRMSPTSAELGFGGFPLELGENKRVPKRYDPRFVSNVSPWNVHVGRYTRFGDVVELVRQTDDRMVTSRSGDEIELTFQDPGPVPDGMSRTYLLFADGFGKDMDPNSGANRTVGPMPFHGMPEYPYPLDVEPPVDMSDTLSRIVVDSGRGWPGALALPLVTAEADRMNTEAGADGP